MESAYRLYLHFIPRVEVRKLSLQIEGPWRVGEFEDRAFRKEEVIASDAAPKSQADERTKIGLLQPELRQRRFPRKGELPLPVCSHLRLPQRTHHLKNPAFHSRLVPLLRLQMTASVPSPGKPSQDLGIRVYSSLSCPLSYSDMDCFQVPQVPAILRNGPLLPPGIHPDAVQTRLYRSVPAWKSSRTHYTPMNSRFTSERQR
jgi:hypothetical protein